MTDDDRTFDPLERLNGRTIKTARREDLEVGRHRLVIEFADGATFEADGNEQRLTLAGGQHFAWASTVRMEPPRLPETVTPRQTREKWKNGLQQGASVRVLLDGSVTGWQPALFMRWVVSGPVSVEERAAEAVLIHNHQTVRVGETRMYPPDLAPGDQVGIERLRKLLLARSCLTGCGRPALPNEGTCLPDGRCKGVRG